MNPSKFEVVANWPIPTTVPELQSLLGFASYYRRFVEGFAKLAAPLHKAVAEIFPSLSFWRLTRAMVVWEQCSLKNKQER